MKQHFNMKMNLIDEQKLWLYSRGGRKMKDVHIDENGEPYVIMSSNHDPKKVKVWVESIEAWKRRYPHQNFDRFIKTI